MYAIEAQGLRKTYPGGVEAVKGIDFEVAPGEVFGLLGPNGAGKSTTIGMLTTTIVPTGGIARLAGYDVAEQPLLARSVSSVVFQEAVVDRGSPGARTSSSTPGCGASRRPGPSGGSPSSPTRSGCTSCSTDRSAATAAASAAGSRSRGRWCSAPQVLFLDEPTVGLDPRIRHELLDVIAGLRAREELTILLTTHYLDEAQRLCDRVAIIHQGSIVALDSPQALLAGLGERDPRVPRRRRPRAWRSACCGPRHRRRRRVRGRRAGHRPAPPPRRHRGARGDRVRAPARLGDRDPRPDPRRRLPAS